MAQLATVGDRENNNSTCKWVGGAPSENSGKLTGVAECELFGSTNYGGGTAGFGANISYRLVVNVNANCETSVCSGMSYPSEECATACVNPRARFASLNGKRLGAIDFPSDITISDNSSERKPQQSRRDAEKKKPSAAGGAN